MIIVILQNPEPDNPIRKNVNVEIRMFIEGATLEEAGKIGDALGKITKIIRPKVKIKAFQVEPDEVPR